MERKMMLQDDIKEFWGFYLLKDSIVKLSVCSRHEGASFIIVKGMKDARRCSFLGELDSVEESDEISNEFEFAHEITEFLQYQNKTNNGSSLVTGVTKPDLIQKLLEVLRGDKSQNGTSQFIEQFRAYQIQKGSRYQDIVHNVDYDDDGNDASEDLSIDEDDKVGNPDIHEIYDLMDQGAFNQENPLDRSREEVRSSWSSSEEALSRCEGLIFNVPLNGGTRCTTNATKDTLDEISTSVTLEATQTGFYYFIFANENEITDNFMTARFNMAKTVFDVRENILNCTDTKECQLPLGFWSAEHVVLEVPDSKKGVDPCDGVAGHSSLEECHRVLVAESVCEPRKSVYMGFLLCVPILILGFASI